MDVISDTLLANWRDWFADRVEHVVADVRARLDAAMVAWELEAPLTLPGGNVAVVIAARRGPAEVVLKLNPDVGARTLASEGAGLRLWAAQGAAPQVLGQRDGGLTLLLERVRPGDSLRDTGASAPEIIETIGGLLGRVHVEAERGRFQSLADAARDDGWFGALAGDPSCGELERLSAPGPGDRLLHIDLHWLNVLRDGERWVVIDPKPQIGDPHADVFAFLDGPPLDDIPADRAAARRHVAGLLDAYAGASGLDRERLEAWLRIRALIFLRESGGRSGEDGAPVARLLDALA